MLIGHQSIQDRFNAQLSDTLRSHAFLFYGPEHVGKRTFANMFAHAYVHGRQRVGEDLGDAYSGDVLVLKPEISEKRGVSKQHMVPVGRVREIIGEFSLSSRLEGRRALIVDDAHMMSVAAQNALLKMIEEPDPGKIIIFITNEVDRILPTVRSRLERTLFGNVPLDLYRGLFPDISDEARGELYALSFGCPGLAVRIHKDVAYAEKLRSDKETFTALPSMTRADRIRLGQQLSGNITETVETLTVWIFLSRSQMFADPLRATLFLRNAERLDQTVRLLRYSNANARILLENVCLVLK